MEWLKKVTDFIMPPVEEEVEEIVESAEQTAGQASRKEEIVERKVANGAAVDYGGLPTRQLPRSRAVLLTSV